MADVASAPIGNANPGASAGSDPNAGTIVVTARPDLPGDPMAQINAQSFSVVQDLDDAVVGPVAMAYEEAIPKPVRHGLRNFINNLFEPIVALNFLLQLKPGKAFETLGRFTINSTIGIGGLVDMAKREPFNLPRRRNGFANTLGFYGVKPGPFLFLPLIGPTTLRDLFGGGIDALILPTALGAPFNDPVYTLPAGVIGALNGRVALDEQLTKIRAESADPYASVRDLYLAKRQAEIDELRGIVRAPAATSPATIGRTPVPQPNSARDMSHCPRPQ
ncbi:VacJ family lipoprotein [Blastomonas sp.]|uniref:MlaA family lipoprotein n=1 Tax=Blastomonas sp. TaxID=1909299 RepID=UPI0035940ECB